MPMLVAADRLFTFATSTRSPHNIPQAMSVLLETSLGDITIDLLVDDAPKCCEK